MKTRQERHYNGRTVRCFEERPPDVYAMLVEASARAPSAEALVSGTCRLTYGQLHAAVERVAANLAAAGLRAGDRLALVLGNRIEFVLCVLAAARLGAISVPINPRNRSPEIQHIVTDCAASMLIFDVDCQHEIPPPATVPDVRARFAVGAEAENARDFESLLQDAAPAEKESVAEESTFCILYTSGTTGKPKGALLTHLGVIHSVMHYQFGMQLSSSDRAVLAVPGAHVTGMIAIILTMVRVGGCTIIMEAFKSDKFLRLAAGERMTYSLMVPTMYNLCLLERDMAAADLSHWRVGGFGGAPMPVATIDRLAQQLPKLNLVNVYGATETTSPATLLPLGDKTFDSVGKVLPCAEIVVVNEQGEKVPAGEAGELWIGGAMVSPGYWQNPEANLRSFAGGFWKSGDLGSIDAFGYVRIFDRKKDVINRGGYKIYCAEVESVLALWPGVLECAVIAQPDDVMGERAHAVLVANGQLDLDGLKAFCREQIANYKVPEFFTVVAEPLPRNANGKVLKTELRKRFAATLHSDSSQPS